MSDKRANLLLTIVALLCVTLLGTTIIEGQTRQPKTAETHFAAGFRLQQSGDHEKALEEYRAALKLDPRMTDVHRSLGALYGILGHYEEGANAFSRVVALKPDFPGAQQNLGVVENFRKILQTEPTHVYANHALRMVYVVTGDKESAMQQYYILKDLNADLVASLLKAISK